MVTADYKKQIEQNNERIKKKKEQIKKLQSDIKELEEKNSNINDEMILSSVKNNLASGQDIIKIIRIGKIVEKSGLTESEIQEMFSKGENSNET